MNPARVLSFSFCLALPLLLASVASCDTPPIGVQALPRDAFPVFDNPHMLSAAAAEREGGKEAKAYPITIMGVHELGNDTIDGIPIAVSW